MKTKILKITKSIKFQKKLFWCANMMLKKKVNWFYEAKDARIKSVYSRSNKWEITYTKWLTKSYLPFPRFFSLLNARLKNIFKIEMKKVYKNCNEKLAKMNHQKWDMSLFWILCAFQRYFFSSENWRGNFL